MAIYKRIASDGKEVDFTDIPMGLGENAGIRNSIKQPVMKRDMERAGKTIVAAGWELTYDPDGYCTTCRRVRTQQ